MRVPAYGTPIPGVWLLTMAARSCSLRQRLPDHRPIHQRQWPALPIGDRIVRVDSQQMIHRRQEVLGTDRLVGYVAGMLIRRADDLAPRDSCPRDQRRISPRPVIAPTSP